MSHFENKNRTNKFTGYRNIVAKKTRSKKHRRRKNQRGAGPETFSEEQKKNIQNEIKKMLEQDPGNITDIEKYIDELTDYDSETVNSTEKKQKLRNFFLEGTNISFDEMEKGMEKEQHMEKGMEKEQYMEKGMKKEQHMEKRDGKRATYGKRDGKRAIYGKRDGKRATYGKRDGKRV
jgi:hypothetical protein